METHEMEEMHIAVAINEGANTKYAVVWALEQFMSQGQTLILLHVRPRVLTIPREDRHIPISMLSKDEVAAYMEEMDSNTDVMALQYHMLCEKKKVNPMFVVVEEDDIASAIVQQISNYDINNLVLGSSSNAARFKGIDVPATVRKNAPSFCAVHEISQSMLSSECVASSTEFQTGSTEDLIYHTSCSSDISLSDSLKTDGLCGTLPADTTILIEEEVHERGTEASPVVIAVAVKESTNAKYALMWALEQFMSQGQTLILLHVRPRVLTIPGDIFDGPIMLSPKDEVAGYMRELDLKTHAMLLQYRHFCKKKKVNTMLVVVEEADDVASAIVQQISNYGISKLVLGSSPNARFKGIDVPAAVKKNAPSFCAVYEISEGMLASVHAASSTELEIDSPEELSDHSSCSSDISVSSSLSTVETSIFTDCPRGGHENDILQNFQTASTSEKLNEPLSQIPTNIMVELEKLRLEHMNTLGMFAVAREEAISAKIEANELALQRIQEARELQEAKVREATARTIAAQEKAKSQEAMRQAEIARQLAKKEAQQRRDAELRAKTESNERKKAQETFASTHQGYRIYTIEEIQSATDFFSESLKIGEGGYGTVYKGNLQHTTVAIKVLSSETTQGIQQQFQRELEVLSQIRHPHMVLLLGACPEHGCLVYEYMANGNLEDRLHYKGNSPLPWFARFRVAWEVASALLFLHSAKPKPIIHRDLKLANILLDCNFVSKIGDVGLARLVPAETTTMVTEYKDSVCAGTLCYIDPEYQRTGICVPKSDLYALGITILQLLTAKPPVALTNAVERAIKNDSFQQILDRNAGNWPLKEALELAMLGLKCAELQRRDRPDLEKDVLPALERFKALADAETVHTKEESDVVPPSHFFCPILEEIMEDPHFTADGFTYEYTAIKVWLENHTTSPMTNLPLSHKHLIPNHSLRSAILEWKTKYGLNN